VPSVLSPHAPCGDGQSSGEPPVATAQHEAAPRQLALRPPLDGGETVAGVIEEARRRRRRRRTLAACLTLAAAAAAGALLRGGGVAHPSHSPGAAGPAARAMSVGSAATLLSREPDLGVACGIPNSFRCDRVGLAVWLRRPAASVTATVAGIPIVLDDPAWSGPAHDGRRTMFAGFLQPAGLIGGALSLRADRGRYWWAGAHPRSARVHIVAHDGAGHVSSATTTVLLRAGWG